MKRSKAAYLIAQAIERSNTADSILLAEQILYTIESIGMAPPFYDYTQNNNGDKVLIPRRSWEPELEQHPDGVK